MYEDRFIALATSLTLLLGAGATAEQSRFGGERAYRHLQQLVRIGNRYYGAPDRDTAIAELTSMVKRNAELAHHQRFTARESASGQTYELVNIVARRNPGTKPRVLLGSHFDTRLWAELDDDAALRNSPIDGANDGTSGVAVLVELLRVVGSTPELSQIGLDVVLFDGEEFGRPGNMDYCRGSKHFVRNLRETYPDSPPVAAIILDMVGDRFLRIRREASSNTPLSRWLTDLVWQAGKSEAKGVFVDDVSTTIIDDHTAFQWAGIPATLIIDIEYPHWHTHRDKLDKVTRNSLDSVGRTLVAALKQLARTRLDESSELPKHKGDKK